jgi:hypothetical protein
MPDSRSVRSVIIADTDWRKLQLIAAIYDVTASDLIRSAIDAVIAGEAEQSHRLATAFRYIDNPDCAEWQPAPVTVPA